MTDEWRRSALGIFEVTGSAALTVATDAMLKAASVVTVSRQTVGAGRIAIAIRGDIASVQAALAAGEDAVAPFSEAEPRTVCLGRPLDDLNLIVEGSSEGVSVRDQVESRPATPAHELAPVANKASPAPAAPPKRTATKRPAAKKVGAKKAGAQRSTTKKTSAKRAPAKHPATDTSGDPADDASSPS